MSQLSFYKTSKRGSILSYFICLVIFAHIHPLDLETPISSSTLRELPAITIMKKIKEELLHEQF